MAAVFLTHLPDIKGAHVLHTSDAAGPVSRVLFFYTTPVAAWNRGRGHLIHGLGPFDTSEERRDVINAWWETEARHARDFQNTALDFNDDLDEVTLTDLVNLIVEPAT
jgi:hypothetical protein